MPSNGALTHHCVTVRALDFGALESREVQSLDLERCAGVGRSAQAPRDRGQSGECKPCSRTDLDDWRDAIGLRYGDRCQGAV